MKFIAYTIALIILGYLVHLFLPWWVIVLLAALIGAFSQFSGIRAFALGFLGIALLWGITAFLINNSNEGILAARFGDLFGGTSANSLILFTTLLGGFLGGLGAMTGALGAKIFKEK